MFVGVFGVTRSMMDTVGERRSMVSFSPAKGVGVVGVVPIDAVAVGVLGIVPNEAIFTGVMVMVPVDTIVVLAEPEE